MEGIQKVNDFLKEAGVFFLATIEGDQPRVRPYGAQLFYEGKLYIMAYGPTNATRQIAANPKAEICAFKGKTLRITCRLVEDKRPELAEALVAQMPSLKPLLGEHGERGVMYCVSDATATFYQFFDVEETLHF